ncbi:DUF3883 domain-containing protein [Bacillus thuringiensis]|uniref:DUF3883 domain-containing protein n=1 Tax=Bacillus thuringiensis TaxID=1428 RepID=UPI002DB7251E|nr:DUF3883 domain-containing protein [Bacillus thuringiensis]MEC3154989.1 DUF3883 domain-containing protein [Bacillus thuringiensis]
MLEKIVNCRAYADLHKCIMVLNVLKLEYRSFQELHTYFSNDIMINMNLVDTLKLFEGLGYLLIVEENDIKKYKVIDTEYSHSSIIKDILNLLIKNKVCELHRIDFDFYIKINQEFYALRNLLLLSESIMKSQIKQFYRIDGSYSSYLQKFSRRISKEQFLKQLEKQNELGEQAEKYVLKLERSRFNSLREIRHVALDDNNIGYDIMSFIDDKSDEYDKFIEVKCYSDYVNRFFISRNEIAQSKKLGENYFLYLVDSKFDSPPVVIQNPYKFIFSNSKIAYEIENISYNINHII